MVIQCAGREMEPEDVDQEEILTVGPADGADSRPGRAELDTTWFCSRSLQASRRQLHTERASVSKTDTNSRLKIPPQISEQAARAVVRGENPTS